jgi:hypothetical protein
MRYVQTIELRSRLQQFLRAGRTALAATQRVAGSASREIILRTPLYSITNTSANSSGQLAPRDSSP